MSFWKISTELGGLCADSSTFTPRSLGESRVEKGFIEDNHRHCPFVASPSHKMPMDSNDPESADCDIVQVTTGPYLGPSSAFRSKIPLPTADGGLAVLLKYTSDDDDDEVRRYSFARDREKREYFWRAENLPWRLVAGSLVSFGLVPAVHSAWTMSRGFRVASGMTSTMTAMAVVPLRTASRIPQAALVVTYVAWAVCFSVYIWLQLINIRPRERRTIYTLSVVFASFHFMAGLSQGADSVFDGAALFGPIAATASAYFMSLLITIDLREAGRVVHELA